LLVPSSAAAAHRHWKEAAKLALCRHLIDLSVHYS
jgi:hypothetical protein